MAPLVNDLEKSNLTQLENGGIVFLR